MIRATDYGLWKKTKQKYISSLALGYQMNEEDIKLMWEIFQSKTRFAIMPKKHEEFSDFIQRYLTVFYVIAIKALNLYIFENETIPVDIWFSDYMDTQFYNDLKENMWFDSSDDPEMYLADHYELVS